MVAFERWARATGQASRRKPDYLIADIDASLVQQILNTPKLRRKPRLELHGHIDDTRDLF